MSRLLAPLLLALLAALATAQDGSGPSIFSEETTPSGGRGLPDDIEQVLTQITALEGGRFGIVVKDLATGETASRNAGSSFDIGNPDLVLVAASMDFVQAGELSLDHMPGPDESIEEIIRWTVEGNDEAAVKIYCSAGKERFPEWLSANGFTDTEFNSIWLDWEANLEIEVNEPNYSTPEDFMGILEHLAGKLDDPTVRRLTRNPLSGNSDLRDLEESFVAVYGTSSLEAGGSSRALVVVLPDGSQIGAVLLADGLCCAAKADLALQMLLEALSGG